MRGFRGSRAAQSFNSRAERNYQRKAERESFLRLVEHGSQPKAPPKLPNWLRGLAAQPQTKAEPARRLPSNVIPITRAKKRVAAAPKKAPLKAKVSARQASAKRK